MPMSYNLRVRIYTAFNGTLRLTPRQRRRAEHKHNHAIAPFTRKAG